MNAAAVTFVVLALASSCSGPQAPTIEGSPDEVSDPAFIVRITEPTQGEELPARELRTIRGEGISALVDLRAVEIALAQVRNGRCDWVIPGVSLKPAGTLDTSFAGGPTTTCRHPPWVARASLSGTRWTVRLVPALPPGNYRLLARGLGPNGPSGGSDGVVFRVT